MNNGTPDTTSIQAYLTCHQTTLFSIARVCTEIQTYSTRIFSGWEQIYEDQCQLVINKLESLKEATQQLLALYGDGMPAILAANRHAGLNAWLGIARHLTEVIIVAVSYQQVYCASSSEDALHQRVRLFERITQLITAIKDALEWRTADIRRLNLTGVLGCQALMLFMVGFESKGKDEVASPPTLPSGYLALGDPEPLLGEKRRWIVRVRCNDANRPGDIGILIYRDLEALVFVMDENATQEGEN